MVYCSTKPEAEILLIYDKWKKVGRTPLTQTGIEIFPQAFGNDRSSLQKSRLWIFDIKDTIGKDVSQDYVKLTKEDYDFLMEQFESEEENFEKP